MKTKLFLSLSLILAILVVASTVEAVSVNPLSQIGYSASKNGVSTTGAISNLIQLNSSQMNNINRIINASNDVDTTLHVGQIVSQVMNSSRSKKYDRLCAKTAMLKFEDTMAEAWQVYAKANTEAFTVRKTAVSTAWDATNLSNGYKGVATAYVNFNKQKLAANKAYNKAKMEAIKIWTADTNACPLAGTPNLAPKISITSPATGATLASTTPVTIAVTALNYSGNTTGIQRVIFYNGTEAVGTDTVAPYTYDWTVTEIGVKSLSASVQDKDGRWATSTAVAITVY